MKKNNITIRFNDGDQDLILDSEATDYIIHKEKDCIYISRVKLSNIIPISQIEEIKFD